VRGDAEGVVRGVLDHAFRALQGVAGAIMIPAALAAGRGAR
jgi:hypothetical protein